MTKDEALALIKSHRDELLNPVEMLDWTWLYAIINSLSSSEWDELFSRASELMKR
jgi:hypothetical protein